MKQRRRAEQVDWRQGKPVFVALGILFSLSLIIGLILMFMIPRQASLVPSVQCLDNLKRLRTAARAYATDHADMLPPVLQPTTVAEASQAIAYPPDAAKVWPAGNWRHALVPYVHTHSVFLCPNTGSAFSYELNSSPQGLALKAVTDPPHYALLWDVGVREAPGRGPHAGKYAVLTLEGDGVVTTGDDESFAPLRFAP